MTRASERILVTAALPYANGYLHLGHMAGAYLPSDMYVRFQRLRGRDVLFLCGSDEHGVAITVSADQEKTTPRAIIDRYHPANETAFRRFGMSFDHYARTSAAVHHQTAQEFFRVMHTAGILRQKEERQLYCERDRMFLADRYVEGTCPVCSKPGARGDQCENCGSWLNQLELVDPACRLCGTRPVVRNTTHWYFPLGSFQQRLEAYVAERDARDGWKENVKQYCAGWFREGLQDRAVTRDLRWGVPVPVEGFEDKVMYVWFDAVLGYISAAKEWATALGDPDAWSRYWQSEGTKYVAFIGKDNVVFHCIVFPAMLMAWNDSASPAYILPENVPANEFLNFEGEKFSKSRGWGIDLREFLDYFPADYLRYALAVNLPETKDADFSMTDFRSRINNELADSVGNLVNRTVAFAHRNFDGTVPPQGRMTEADRAFEQAIVAAPAAIGDLYESYAFREATQQAIALARTANKYFNDTEPWKTVSSDRERCGTTIRLGLRAVHALSILLSPVTPEICRRMRALIGTEAPEASPTWDHAGQDPFGDGHRILPAEVLVPKIEPKEIQKMTDELTSRSAAPADGLVTIDQFKKLELTVGSVRSAERIPKSDKLLRLMVDLGTEERQIVAGIAQHVPAENLPGKQVIIVSNLAPAKIMGVESNGMLLAAHGPDGTLRLVTLDAPLPPGSRVR